MSEHDFALEQMLDRHLEAERQAAEERAADGSWQAVRLDAEPQEISFAELRQGDYMTAESGRFARYVRVTEIVERGELLAVSFETPQPLGLGYHERFTIERPACERVVIDAAGRPAQ